MIELENASVRLVGCMHPSSARMTPAGQSGLLICELCGSASRDDSPWKAPALVQELADAANAISAERARAVRESPCTKYKTLAEHDGCMACFDFRQERAEDLEEALADARALLREYMPGQWVRLHERIDNLLPARIRQRGDAKTET